MTGGDDRQLTPGQSPGFLLWRVTNRWQRSIVAALKPLGLTHVQFVLLASVWWLSRDGAGLPTQRDVADQAGTDPMTTSQVLRTLERRGQIERARDPEDGRARRVASTANGTQLAREAIEVVEAADRAFFAQAEPGELMRVLHSLVDPSGSIRPLPAPAAPTRP